LDDLHSKKLEKERSKVVAIINQNREAESKLLRMIEDLNDEQCKKDPSFNEMELQVQNCTLKMFSKLCMLELKVFAHVRLFNTSHIDKSVLKNFPKKGQYDSAKKIIEEDLDDNLITLCFKLKGNEPILL
jgi:hypothetical protein